MAESLLARLHEAAGAEHEGAIEDEKQWTLHFRYIILPIALFQTHYIVNLLRSTASANAAAAFRGAQVRFAVLGLAWCIAALWVEFKLEKGNQFYAGPDYVPFCDFAPWAKCSKVLMSPVGRLMQFIGVASPHSALDYPNPFMGLVFFGCHLAYPLLCSLPFGIGKAMPFLATAVSAIVGVLSCFLGYILFVVLHDFCIVCVSSYVVNFSLLYIMFKIYASGGSGKAKGGQ